jgi:hypothetical protein
MLQVPNKNDATTHDPRKAQAPSSDFPPILIFPNLEPIIAANESPMQSEIAEFIISKF